MPLTFTAHAQTDNEYILQAKNTIQTTKNCDAVLGLLNKVSAAGKMSADYLLYMGKAHDCKSNDEQTLYYYNKYLGLQPADDSVRKRVAELTDKKNQEARVANEINAVRESYQNSSRKRYKKKKNNGNKLNINDNFWLWGLSMDRSLGGVNAPYKVGVSGNYSGNYSIIHNHVILGYTFNGSYLFSPNKDWFSRVFGIPVSAVSGVNNGYSVSIVFAPAAVIINRHKFSLTVGPEIGGGFVYTPEVSETYGSGAAFDDGGDFGLSYGIRSNFGLWKSVAFYAEYVTFSGKSVSTEFAGVKQFTPVNHDMFRVGISCWLESWGSWGWW